MKGRNKWQERKKFPNLFANHADMNLQNGWGDALAAINGTNLSKSSRR